MEITNILETESDLRSFYGEPMKNSVLKVKDALDAPSKEFIADSPFLCLATVSPDGAGDCSPKGDPPGFVKILDDKTIAIPDRMGNNRLDSLSNLIQDPRLGILFFVPGRNDTLRINGRGVICRDPKLMAELAHNGKEPTVVLVVRIEEVYLHCPKALMRSDLWKRGLDIQGMETYVRDASRQLGKDLSEEEVKQKSKEYEEGLKDRMY